MIVVSCTNIIGRCHRDSQLVLKPQVPLGMNFPVMHFSKGDF